MERGQYLIVTGVLFSDNRFELRPGYLSDSPEYAEEDPNSPLVAEMVDDSGRVLLHHRVPVSGLCAGAALDALAVIGKVPFPWGTRVVRFVRDDRVLHEIPVARTGPVVKITWRPPERPAGKQVITWRGQHAEGRPLHYMVAYSNSGSVNWEFQSLTIQETAYELDFDRLPGGPKCQVGVIASDGVNTVLQTTTPFSVPVKPCQALLLAPEDGARVAAGQAILLRGQGYYLEEQQPELKHITWASSLDGNLGAGPVLQAVLSPGVHQITLFTGTGERQGHASTSVTVRPVAHRRGGPPRRGSRHPGNPSSS